MRATINKQNNVIMIVIVIVVVVVVVIVIVDVGDGAKAVCCEGVVAVSHDSVTICAQIA